MLRIHTTIRRLPVPGWGRSSRRVPVALNRLKPYTFHIALVIYWPVLLYADAQVQALTQQHALGALTFAFLIVATRFSSPSERRQVWLMVGIATCVELFCSVVWGLYRYRWGNVPLFVPPGHGLLYLFALRAARTPLMVNHGRAVCRVALACATVWAVGGLTVGPLFLGRVDALGALLWPIFVWLMRKPAAVVYAASFFITAELELLGTGFGIWTWAAAAPVIHLPAGNPPSVIAGGYCVMDTVTSKVATLLPAAGVFSRLLSRLRPGQLNLGLYRRRTAIVAFSAIPLSPPSIIGSGGSSGFRGGLQDQEHGDDREDQPRHAQADEPDRRQDDPSEQSQGRPEKAGEQVVEA